jgi:hypothetical protein
MGWEYWVKAQASALSSTPLQRSMWYRLKNIFSSLRTYNSLSPDLRVRRQVNQKLRDRPALNLHDWFEAFYHAQGVPYTIATFAYTYLSQYSGLDIGRILPHDRLHEDLHWTQVCWFDWETNLCNDFYRYFGIDISDRFDPSCFLTIWDLIIFLNLQWKSHQ